MDRDPTSWSVHDASMRKTAIDPKPQYQRGDVWTRPQKQLFIDSILRNYDIPKLYLREVTDSESEYQWEIVDGQQRLTALWEFLQDHYPISEKSASIEGYTIKGKLFKEFDMELRIKFYSYNLSVVLLKNAEDEEIRELFRRLQSGVPLNPAEKRNAISGGLRDFVATIATTNKLFTTTLPFKNKRYSHDELVAQMLLIHRNGGPTTVRHEQLSAMYESNRTYNPNSKQAQTFRKVMNFLAKAFPDKTPELRVKANIVSLFTIASEFLPNYAISSRWAEFTNWFISFEQRRIKENGKPENQRDKTMVSYTDSVRQGTASQPAQEIRRRILKEDLIAAIPDLENLDPKRLFSHEQRTVIYRKANGKCANPQGNTECEETCGWDDFHADHIIPHSEGGQTSVTNGRLLCPSCNLKKSNK